MLGRFFYACVVKNIIAGMPAECLTVWLHISLNAWPGLIFVQTVAKCPQQSRRALDVIVNTIIMGLDATKPIFTVSEKARLKPSYAATETS